MACAPAVLLEWAPLTSALAVSMDRTSLIERVRREFAGVSRKEGRTLHEAIGLDNYLSGDELNRERARDADTRWEDVPAADIESNPEVFPFLDFDGFVYYLPAYIVWSLENFDKSASASSDHVLYTLDHRGVRSSTRRLWFDQMTEGQKAVVADFLRFMSQQTLHADNEAALAALESYWDSH